MFATYIVLAGLSLGLSPARSTAALSPLPVAARETTSWIDGTEILRSQRQRLGAPALPPAARLAHLPQSKRALRTEQLGEIRYFWLVDFTSYTLTNEINYNEDKIQIPAELVRVTDHAYIYQDLGTYLDGAALDMLASEFEESIQPAVNAVYGSPPDSLDGDPRVTILVSVFPGTSMAGATVAGYFDDANQYTDAEAMYMQLGHSNEREMLLINQAFLADSGYWSMALGIFAHEYQHLIHWARDRNEAVWFNEGNSEFAMLLSGYDDSVEGHTMMYAFNPTLSLIAPNGFLEQEQYGAVFYFLLYLNEHYGGDAGVSTLAHSPLTTVEGVDAYLRQHHGVTFRQVYRDWHVANMLDEPNGVYSYAFERKPSFWRRMWEVLGGQVFFTARFDSFTGAAFATYLEQWASEYYLFHRAGYETGQDFHGFLQVDDPAYVEATYVSLNKITDTLGFPAYTLRRLDTVAIDPSGYGEFSIPQGDDYFALIVHHTSASTEETDCTTMSYSMGVRPGLPTVSLSDSTPPSAVNDLRVEKVNGDRVTLAWTAPGDDATAGWASLYDLRYFTDAAPSTATFTSGTRVATLSHPKVSGTSETHACLDLPEETALYFLLKTIDEAGNVSWSNTVEATTGPRDRTPPATILTLHSESKTSNTVSFGWTAPGDDGDVGRAARYDIRWSYEPIVDEMSFRHGHVVAPPEPAPAGVGQSLMISDVEWDKIYIAIRSEDEMGNLSGISNVLRFNSIPGEPQIILHPVPQTVDPGSTVTFSVVTTGTVPLQCQWRKDGVDLPESGCPDGPSTHTLTLSNVQQSDEGLYACKVTNAIGLALSQSATLSVNDPPEVTLHPLPRDAKPGDAVTFVVEASGAAPLEYQWKKDGVDIPGATTASLTIPSVQNEDAGEYRCEVRNALGSDLSDVALLRVLAARKEAPVWLLR